MEIITIIGVLFLSTLLASKKPHMPRFQASLNGGRAVSFPTVGMITTAVKLTFGLGRHFRDAGFSVNDEWGNDEKVWVLAVNSDRTAPVFTHNSLVKEFSALAAEYFEAGAKWAVSALHDELDFIEVDNPIYSLSLEKYAGQFGQWHLTKVSTHPDPDEKKRASPKKK